MERIRFFTLIVITASQKESARGVRCTAAYLDGAMNITARKGRNKRLGTHVCSDLEFDLSKVMKQPQPYSSAIMR